MGATLRINSLLLRMGATWVPHMGATLRIDSSWVPNHGWLGCHVSLLQNSCLPM